MRLGQPRFAASTVGSSSYKNQLGLPSTTLLVGKYEVGEPRLLGQGRYGPVIRARDVHSRELVAVKARGFTTHPSLPITPSPVRERTS